MEGGRGGRGFTACPKSTNGKSLLFWWLCNPWWDLVMLTFFAIANALWQNCGMCKQKANACNKGCTTCQGGGAGPPPPPPPVR